MSYTNKTSHYELPQYVATDKPKYLTDFNETMATIDGQMYTNATAATTAQTAAEGAQSTADGAVSSISTLNTQINGDPTDPSDTGLAGDVSALDGDVNTIQALLGNGTPTTSNQTVIGAVNAIEASIAPAEDSATLGANYVTGAQFARGGVVYEALTNLTSGTAFTSLTLNTDYKVADTLVKQIADVKGDVADVKGDVAGYILKEVHRVSVTAAADDTVTTMIAKLFAACDTYLNGLPSNYYVSINRVRLNGAGLPDLVLSHPEIRNANIFSISTQYLDCTAVRASEAFQGDLIFGRIAPTINLHSAHFTFADNTWTNNDKAASAVTGTSFIDFNIYKRIS